LVTSTNVEAELCLKWPSTRYGTVDAARTGVAGREEEECV
jgi:hypothetical protein